MILTYFKLVWLPLSISHMFSSCSISSSHLQFLRKRSTMKMKKISNDFVKKQIMKSTFSFPPLKNVTLTNDYR